MQIPIDKNIFISAGAGTGKTHILVQRFIQLLEQKKAEVPEIAAITFTEKAAKEMKDRIRDACTEEKHKRDLENSRIGTIHGFCARLIKENPIEVGIDPMSDILDETESYALLDKIIHGQILDLLSKEDADTEFIVSEYGFTKTKDILQILIGHRIDIDNIKLNYPKPVDGLDKKAVKINEHIFRIYEKAAKGYQDYKKKKSLLDFNDLIIYALRLLRDNKTIRRHYQKIIKYILVDEYQDTDFHQREIIFFLAEDGAVKMADEPEDIILANDKLFIVGDSKQSIYRFRGADVSVFEDTRRILEKNGEIINLNINMRSLPHNIEFFNDLFGKIMGRDREGKEDYESSYGDILPKRKSPPTPPVVEFLSVPKEPEDLAENIRQKEAGLIARKICQITGDEFKFKDISVLFRAMTDIKLYEDVFRKYKIPYYVIAGSGFYGRQEIKDILNYLKVLDNENDKIALAGVLRSPMFGLSDNDLYWWSKDKKLPEEISQLGKLKNSISISSLIEEIVIQTNYRAILSAQYMGEQKISNVNKLIETARRFEEKGIFTLADFIQYVNDLVVNEAREGEAAISEEESNVVKIMTIHKAKGLEFPVVIIPDIQRRPKPTGGPVLFDRKFPWLGVKVKDEDGEFQEPPMRKLIKQEIEKKELAESKRLLYVASTRVRDYLIYSGNFEKQNNNWSTWLSEYMDSDKVKITTDLPLAEDKHGKVRPCHVWQGLTLPCILRQIEPIPAGSKTRFTATESRFKGPKSAIEIHKFFKNWNFDETNVPDFAKAFVKDPIFQEIKNSQDKRKELPITYKYSEGIMEGVIDLLFKTKDGDWVILDYKTDNITKEEVPARAIKYKNQLETYAEGIKKILGVMPKKLIIFFLTPGVAFTQPLHAEAG